MRECDVLCRVRVMRYGCVSIYSRLEEGFRDYYVDSCSFIQVSTHLRTSHQSQATHQTPRTVHYDDSRNPGERAETRPAGPRPREPHHTACGLRAHSRCPQSTLADRAKPKAGSNSESSAASRLCGARLLADKRGGVEIGHVVIGEAQVSTPPLVLAVRRGTRYTSPW